MEKSNNLEESELKYIVNGDDEILKDLIKLFKLNQFEVISTTVKENYDKYYDTLDLSLYELNSSLRIRETIIDGDSAYKGTYKMPLGNSEVYSSRTEVEEDLKNSNYHNFENAMKEINVPIDFAEIIKEPIINVSTFRVDILLEKNGVRVCLSLDKCIYLNYFLDNIVAKDRMVEIEAIDIPDILNEIHDFMTNFKNIKVNKQSKYTRGISRTLDIYRINQEKKRKNNHFLH